MSLRGQKGVGIPTVLLHEGEGLIVTVETRAGYTYRGAVETVEDSMNLGLRSVTVVAPDGAESTLDRVFIRGGQVLFVVFPDVLRLAPMFERLRKAAAGLSTAGGLGRGRLAAIEAKGACIGERRAASGVPPSFYFSLSFLQCATARPHPPSHRCSGQVARRRWRRARRTCARCRNAHGRPWHDAPADDGLRRTWRIRHAAGHAAAGHAAAGHAAADDGLRRAWHAAADDDAAAAVAAGARALASGGGAFHPAFHARFSSGSNQKARGKQRARKRVPR
jgi:small nuclear ribonucleoprotein D3